MFILQMRKFLFELQWSKQYTKNNPYKIWLLDYTSLSG